MEVNFKHLDDLFGECPRCGTKEYSKKAINECGGVCPECAKVVAEEAERKRAEKANRESM